MRHWLRRYRGVVDGYCERAMIIASVEQVEVGNIMELSITGHVLKRARQSNLFVAGKNKKVESEESQ